MAMTKAEIARVADLEKGLQMARSMRWPEYRSPAPMTEAEIRANLVDGGMQYGRPQKVARGWFGNSYQHGSVSFGCSNGIHHSSTGDVTTTQQMGRMFWSELDAWKAVRLEMTQRYAENLARIDAKIADLQDAAP